METDSYIVRIYRRPIRNGVADDAGASCALVGMVENVAGTERRKFHGIRELWAILARPSDTRDCGDAQDERGRCGTRNAK